MLTNTIEEWRVKAYQNNVMQATQQHQSKLEQFCEVGGDFKGNMIAFDSLGTIDPETATGENDDTQYMDVGHYRRWGFAQRERAPILLPETANVDTIHEPTNPYVTAMRGGFERKKDKIIITRALDTVMTGEMGDTPKAFPTSQIIAADGTGFTLDKMLEIKERFGISDADEIQDGRRVICVISPRQITDLLSITEVRSKDFNDVGTLYHGKVVCFMGLWFTKHNKLLKDENDNRRCLAFVEQSIGLTRAHNPLFRIGQESTKNYRWSIFSQMEYGAVRKRDEEVLDVRCVES